jgi:immunoglobulin-binding protein 1
MANEQENIRTLFARARDLHARISTLQSNTEEYQQNLHAALSTLHRCREQIQQVGLFSPNETEDDIASGDLPYLSVDYQLAELLTRSTATDRKSVLKKAQATYEDYLHRLDIYGIIVGDNKRLYKEYVDNKDRFTLLSQTDPSKRRETKIARYNQQKDLKQKLEVWNAARKLKS